VLDASGLKTASTALSPEVSRDLAAASALFNVYNKSVLEAKNKYPNTHIGKGITRHTITLASVLVAIIGLKAKREKKKLI